MITVIGITQFVFLSLGIMAMNILVKVGNSKPQDHPPLSLFLYQYGLWLFLIPVAWILLAGLFVRPKSRLSYNLLGGLGIALAAAILGVFGYAILFLES
ncbi:hypothetical protein BH09VER1_BH09VER1_39770 [soil metagenome]